MAGELKVGQLIRHTTKPRHEWGWGATRSLGYVLAVTKLMAHVVIVQQRNPSLCKRIVCNQNRLEPVQDKQYEILNFNAALRGQGKSYKRQLVDNAVNAYKKDKGRYKDHVKRQLSDLMFNPPVRREILMAGVELEFPTWKQVKDVPWTKQWQTKEDLKQQQ